MAQSVVFRLRVITVGLFRPRHAFDIVLITYLFVVYYYMYFCYCKIILSTEWKSSSSTVGRKLHTGKSSKQEALLKLCHFCSLLASTAQYLERSLFSLISSSSDLPMRSNKFCSVLFGVLPVDWYKRSRRLLLSTYSTVEICWQHSTLYQSSSQFPSYYNCPNLKRWLCQPFWVLALWLAVYQCTKFKACILYRCPLSKYLMLKISCPWNLGQASLKVIENSTVRNLGYAFPILIP